MRLKIYVALLLIGVLGLSILSNKISSQLSAPKWEYLYVTYDTQNGTISAFLNDEAASSALTKELTDLKAPLVTLNPAPAGQSDETRVENAQNVLVILDNLGQQGWELVSSDLRPGSPTSTWVLVLKRNPR